MDRLGLVLLWEDTPKLYEEMEKKEIERVYEAFGACPDTGKLYDALVLKW